MTQQHLTLPVETALRLQVARLLYEQAQLQAQLLQQQRDMLLLTAERTFTDSVTQALTAGAVDLPVPLAQCTFDPEQGCLLYEDEAP